GAAHKVIDEEHTFALQKALSGKKVTILALDGVDAFKPFFFKVLRRLGLDRDRQIVIYLKDALQDIEQATLLASMSAVRFVVLKRESLRHLCDVVQPDEAYLIEREALIPLSSSG